ncbi:MAG: MotA/TolQ/ExbB proton channel family protein [Ignavibacteria bacterium]|nr:MotA/TolQ/ExbB proton channel family protein [Ignavibacteria bacterium]
MRFSSGIALLFGFIAVFGAFVWESGSLESIFLGPALLIVVGGTLAAGLAGTSVEVMARMPKLIWIALYPKRYDKLEIIDQFVELSIFSRKEGILALERRLEELKHPYMKRLFTLMIDGIDPQELQKLAETEVGYMTERHNVNITLFQKLGGYSPTMGIIGTVMGLIATLASAGSDPTVLIRHIATAFIATMWGIILANLLWLPIGDKLRVLHLEEVELMQMILDGTLAIQLGEVPSVVRSKLLASLPIAEQEKYLQERATKIV